ncbi:MAG: hypothetical protein JL55_21440 [Pseudomonas sp. BICA1-14]|uniref:hypothetical protein n=1 Tax=Stutzerimonas kunmingensis TaxID=1211807 RepID=UPI0005B43340|nr:MULTISPECIES: hypothetical protein [Stutzerimonas stutzeri group]KJS74700.1 MAG: hypothetical protein JL55_21440 [[Pseudomonas] sp. BICA1-14]
MDMEELFRSRPFKTRNADEYDLSSILNLYVNPINGLNTPFDYENTIIKGRMGSGKTMFLRANYAYYLYGMVPSLIENSSELILPVFIRLSDFQHIKNSEEVYRNIIIKIVEELTSVYLKLIDAKKLAEIHTGFRFLKEELFSAHKLANSMKQLSKLGSEEYIERVTQELLAKGGAKCQFLELSAEWKDTHFSEIKKKPNPGIKDIEDCYKNLLEGQDGKILLLIDEAGALDKKFFQNDSGSGFFEILMNQLRTASFIRTKIAVYPNSFSDMLTETRYGSVVLLEERIQDERAYRRFRKRAIDLINNYLNPCGHENGFFQASDVFSLSDDLYGDCLEQLLYASQGNMRRLIQLLDLSLNVTFREHYDELYVTKETVGETLKEHAEQIESIYGQVERDFIEKLASICKARGAYKFTFPNMSPILYKYTNKSQEYNVINIEELGSGRKGTIYSFDYACAVLKDLPTHSFEGGERVNKERSLQGGKWINRVAQISSQLLEQAALPGKIEGTITYYDIKNERGFVGAEGNEAKYFFQKEDILEQDRAQVVFAGKRVRFQPGIVGTVELASYIEIL